MVKLVSECVLLKGRIRAGVTSPALGAAMLAEGVDAARRERI